MIPTDKVPIWLLEEAGSVSTDRIQVIDSARKSWAKLAPIVNTLSEPECCYLIVEELTTRKIIRPEFIQRPFNRIVSIRKRWLWSKLKQLTPGVHYA